MRLYAVFAALLIASVDANSCNKGGVYCGQSLLNKGNYYAHIVETLRSVGQPTDDTHVRLSIFDCLSNGDIRYRGFCSKGCGGVGNSNADYCF
ncbi:hypothetical protein CYLTODRAFT_350963 [Cylindrobasidium torrendii FP15055 ss-10]|uniref:Uncharacterized protein n=1 Tax=Cylindrobasidium torrendii FP15055 ss-10 TaxID=1314674 RepID=A0A0D7BEQ2_9AGAR|nr:hypothetical protein CYLTODRAFT_350963 [Cylindrobasidium torrendii FP15055 ss-10]